MQAHVTNAAAASDRNCGITAVSVDGVTVRRIRGGPIVYRIWDIVQMCPRGCVPNVSRFWRVRIWQRGLRGVWRDVGILYCKSVNANMIGMRGMKGAVRMRKEKVVLIGINFVRILIQDWIL